MVKNSWRDPTHCKFAHDRFKPISFPAEPREFRSFFHPSRCLNNRDELFHRTGKAVTTPAVSIDYEIYRTISGKLRARLPIESRFRWKEREREFLSFYSANPSVASNRGAGRLITLDNRGGGPLFRSQKLRGSVYRNRGCGTDKETWCNLRFSQVRHKLLTLRPNWV